VLSFCFGFAWCVRLHVRGEGELGRCTAVRISDCLEGYSSCSGNCLPRLSQSYLYFSVFLSSLFLGTYPVRHETTTAKARDHAAGHHHRDVQTRTPLYALPATAPSSSTTEPHLWCKPALPVVFLATRYPHTLLHVKYNTSSLSNAARIRATAKSHVTSRTSRPPRVRISRLGAKRYNSIYHPSLTWLYHRAIPGSDGLLTSDLDAWLHQYEEEVSGLATGDYSTIDRDVEKVRSYTLLSRS